MIAYFLEISIEEGPTVMEVLRSQKMRSSMEIVKDGFKWELMILEQLMKTQPIG